MTARLCHPVRPSDSRVRFADTGKNKTFRKGGSQFLPRMAETKPFCPFCHPNPHLLTPASLPQAAATVKEEKAEAPLHAAGRSASMAEREAESGPPTPPKGSSSRAQFKPRGRRGMEGLQVVQSQSLASRFQDIYVGCLKVLNPGIRVFYHPGLTFDHPGLTFNHSRVDI